MAKHAVIMHHSWNVNAISMAIGRMEAEWDAGNDCEGGRHGWKENCVSALRLWIEQTDKYLEVRNSSYRRLMPLPRVNTKDSYWNEARHRLQCGRVWMRRHFEGRLFSLDISRVIIPNEIFLLLSFLLTRHVTWNMDSYFCFFFSLVSYDQSIHVLHI